MKYENLVKSHAHKLIISGLWKITSDIAAILDDPIFGYPNGEKIDSYMLCHRAQIREELYDIFCAAFASISLPLPPLEPEFYESVLKKKVEEKNSAEAKRISNHVGSQIKKSKDTTSVTLRYSIIQIIQMFPSCLDYDSLDRRTLIAQLNKLLIDDGCEPIRPDYSVWKRNGASQMKAPESKIRILVVDDDIAELAKTLRRLAGWQNIILLAFKYNRRGYSNEPKIATELVSAAKDIAYLRPDVVLMDQCLDTDLDGSALIPVIKGIAPNIRFVSNTSGSDDEQRKVGAFPSSNKGENLKPIAQAIESFN